MTSRRNILTGGAAGILAIGGGLLWWRQSGDVDDSSFEVTRTEEEWRDILTGDEFTVLREEDTEEPFSSPLNEETRPGIYSCADCPVSI